MRDDALFAVGRVSFLGLVIGFVIARDVTAFATTRGFTFVFAFDLGADFLSLSSRRYSARSDARRCSDSSAENK